MFNNYDQVFLSNRNLIKQKFLSFTAIFEDGMAQLIERLLC